MTPQQQAANALRHLALDEGVKAYILEHPPLYRTLFRAAKRFIGGETLSDCRQVASNLNEQGHAVTIDFMGESTRDAAAAEGATQEFLAVIRTIAEANLNASVSLDLSHVGLVVDPMLGYANAALLAQEAEERGLEVMISAEGIDRTDAVLDIHARLCERFSNVGITVQAYLHRTSRDLAAVLERAGKIRLVKGAFAAPDELVVPRGEHLNRRYCQLMEQVVTSGRSLSIATHDPPILDYAHELLKGSRTTAEFEMLKGVSPERLEAMKLKGYRTRVYLPYGLEWHLYLCNRLAEYPPNVYGALSDMFTPTSSNQVVCYD